MKINIYSLGTFFLLVGTAVQFGHFTITRYFVPMLTFLFTIVAFFFHSRFKISPTIKNNFLFHSMIFISFILLSLVSYSAPTGFIFGIAKLFLAFGLSFLVFYTIVNASDMAIAMSVRFMTIINLLVLTIDTAARLQTFNYSEFTRNIYVYKLDSLFFSDSNGSALYGLLFFIIIFYFYKYVYLKKSWFFRIALLMMIINIILTFSRAAILGTVIFFLFHLWITRKNIFLKYSTILLFVGIIILLTPLLIKIVSEDASGDTKLLIYKCLWDKFWIADIRAALFGYGIKNGTFVYSYEAGGYAHGLIPMITGQFGLIGLILYFFFFLKQAFKTKGHSLYLFIPAFVTGLSYIPPFFETLFFANAFIVAIYFRNKQRGVKCVKN